MWNFKLYVIACIFLSVSANNGKGRVIRVLTGLPLPPFLIPKWDPSGNMSEATGVFPPYMDLISQRFRLTYSWVPTGKSLLTEDTPTQKGLITHLIEDKGDVAMGAFVPTMVRYRLVDFTTPVLESPFSILIPFPSSKVNNGALVEPFKIEVWIGLFASLFAVISFWYLIDSIEAYLITLKSGSTTNRNNLYVPLSYALTVILTQGNSVPKRVLPIRLIAGIWCLAAFVLVPAYSGNLTSFLASPIQKPIIDSYQDIITSVPSGLKVAVERGLGVDVQLQYWASLFKSGALNSTVGKMASVANDSTYRCTKMADCVEKVVAFGDHVAIAGTPQALQLISDDWKHAGKCRITLAKHSFNKAYTVWLISKNNPFLNVINQGILEIDAHGLSNYWRDYYNQRGKVCLKISIDQNQDRQLSLIYMSSTLIVYLVGCALAMVAFVSELLIKSINISKNNNRIS